MYKFWYTLKPDNARHLTYSEPQCLFSLLNMPWFISSHSVYSHNLKMKVPLKHWYISTELYCITLHKTGLNIHCCENLKYQLQGYLFCKEYLMTVPFPTPFPQAFSCFKTRDTKHKVSDCKNLLTEQTNCKFRSLLRVAWPAEIMTHLFWFYDDQSSKPPAWG
jgi:hypothetical protein